MSTSIYKVPYICDCGCNYGDCGADCAIILKSNNSVNVYNLFHTDSHYYINKSKEPVTTEGGLDCFSDSYMEALAKLLSMKDDNPGDLTEQERSVIFK